MHRVRQLLPVPDLLGQQRLLEVAGDRAQDVLRWQRGEPLSEARTQYLAVAHVAEQMLDPGELGVEGRGVLAVEHRPQHPQHAAEPAHRHPCLVDIVEPAA